MARQEGSHRGEWEEGPEGKVAAGVNRAVEYGKTSSDMAVLGEWQLKPSFGNFFPAGGSGG